ncbi:MFS transporter [Clostridium grantii]|uniref:Oligogalacturonide transporter n=1 Tax=Clostridium grantii DSM 8605 TaxID=1121316 RepID=A0A1M5W634_9CLOT|nr:MFS transporter [Clostridium grantii]SHH82935.1 oligogalacturonide transporter [Clostridium grantii DSM 8605]
MNNKKLSNKNIFSYAIGDFYGGGAFFIIGALFLVFLTDVGGLKSTYAGIIILVGKIWDAVTDPTMGYISDHTKSKHGRRRIYFLVGIIPIMISFALLWVNVNTPSQVLKFIYYLVTYLLFNTVFTMVMVPYNSMPAEMTDDYKERSKLISIRMVFSQFGALLGAVLPLTIINSFQDKGTGFLIMGVMFGIMYACPWYFVFKGTSERQCSIEDRNSKGMMAELKDLFKEFASTYKNKSLKIHLTMYVCAYVAMDIFNALLIYYLRNYLGKESFYQVILGVLVIVEMGTLYFVAKECSKTGNAATYRRHSIIWVIGIILLGLATPNTPVGFLIALAAIVGIGLSGDVMVPYNMLAFVVDADELISMRRREGTYAGMMTFLRKLAQAFALFLVGVGLDLVGYQSGGVIKQTTSAITGIRIMFCIIPVLLISYGFYTSFKFKIDPKNHKILMEEINRLKEGGKKETVEAKTKEVCEDITGISYEKLWSVNG